MSAPTWDTCLVCGAHGSHHCPGVAAVIAEANPAPSAEPEYVDYRDDRANPSDSLGPFWLHLPRLRAVLSRAGLAIVPAADVTTPEERKVLEACAAAEVVMLSNGWRMLDGNSNRSVVEAELARRATKEKTDG